MVARIKSRVLVREEKGGGPVSMKRIMACGMGAGMFYFVSTLLVPAVSLPVLLVGFASMIYATGDRYGLPRYRWVAAGRRAAWLLSAQRHSSGLAAVLCGWLNWDVSVVLVDGDRLYSGSGVVDDGGLAGIEFLDSDALDAGGFEVLSEEEVLLMIVGE